MFDELWEADRRAKEERETQRVQRQQTRNLQQLDFIRSQMEAAEQQTQKQRELREEEASLMVCIDYYYYTFIISYSHSTLMEAHQQLDT